MSTDAPSLVTVYITEVHTVEYNPDEGGGYYPPSIFIGCTSREDVARAMALHDALNFEDFGSIAEAFKAQRTVSVSLAKAPVPS